MYCCYFVILCHNIHVIEIPGINIPGNRSDFLHLLILIFF
uniref:Uncharacterized protein n=1 Tax=Myoviridae sp. ctgsk7 TaxID=2825151 RepID=A0A8S5PYR7_9CAUD|nr:MAG TPA: hypothetical protein [Myoviridae sp. ctgsk7]